MLTQQEFNEAEIFRNTTFTKGAIRYGWNPPDYVSKTGLHRQEY